jgi:hypothetical protein
LFATGVCRPVAVAARGAWRFEQPVFFSDTPVFGGGRPGGRGAASGELDADEAWPEDERAVGALIACLRSAYVALVGPVRLGGRVGRVLSFTFTEEVSHEPA